MQNTTVVPAKTPTHNRVDIVRAMRLRLQGLSYQEIANLQGVAKSSVIEALQKFNKLLENPEEIKAWRENKAELLEAVEARLISSLPTDIDVKKGKRALSGYQKAGMFGLIFDKIRLLRGESTVNLNSLSALVIGAAKDFAKNNSNVSREINAVSEPEDEPIDVTPEPNNIKQDDK